ncbi:MAG: hypothetical protein KA175_12315 [Flavobacteriales bacterium]|nr:hypothetical protein [Flavobacteriales bacterium]
MATIPEPQNVQHQLRVWKTITLLCMLSMIALWWRTLSTMDQRASVIRTRGIIVEDSLGRDRILIGAPFPSSAHRVRTDPTNVRARWAQRLGGERYMEWYKRYRHDGVGMVVLNAEGYDRVLVGDGLPDPNTGQRISSPTGLLWNDHEGFELGGIGANRLLEGGEYRNGLGLDDKDGEGLHLIILEDGSKVMRTVYPGGMLVEGRLAAKGFFGDSTDFVGSRLIGANGEVVAEERLH